MRRSEEQQNLFEGFQRVAARVMNLSAIIQNDFYKMKEDFGFSLEELKEARDTFEKTFNQTMIDLVEIKNKIENYIFEVEKNFED